MIKTAGAVLVGLSAVFMGTTLSSQMRNRLHSVSAFRDSVLRMQQKVAYYRLPLPALMQELAQECENGTKGFYTRAADRLERNRTRTAEAVLMRCLRDERFLGLPQEGVQIAARLFRCLGRMDAAHQTEAIRRITDELDELEERLREELRKRSRCWCAIGICGGMAITILLV